MPRIGLRDASAVAELATRLGTLERATRPALASLVIELRSLLGADRVLAHSVGLDGGEFVLEFGYGSGFPIPMVEVNSFLTAGLRRMQGQPWSLYDPRLPESAQRNRAVTIPPSSALAGPRGDALFAALQIERGERDPMIARVRVLDEGVLRRISMNGMHTCRALICEGHSLLAWIGAVRTDPFTSREQMLLQRLVPALARRLRLERQLEHAQLHAAMLAPLLEAVAAEAFIIDAAARIQHANSAGRATVDRDAPALREQLRAALARRETTFDVTTVVAPGLPPSYLAIRLRSSDDPGPRLGVAAARWGLTRRQAQVLALLVRGEPTKQIATCLGCASRTIEVHITRILARAGVDSRAALIARFWSS